MTEPEIRAAVLVALRRVVPDADPSTLAADTDLRQAVDMDSIDFLRFLVSVRDLVGVDVPDGDYHLLRTLDGIVTYLARRLASPDVAPQPPA